MALNDDKMTAMVTYLKTTGALNDLERKFWATFSGSGGGNGVISIPSNYIFKGANRQAAEAVRNALFTGDPSLLKDGVQVVLHPADTNVPILQEYQGNKWNDISPVIQGPKGDPGAGLDASKLKANEIPIWNPVTSTLDPSGISATDGELVVSPDSVVFGNHRMSSSIENVIFTNTDTGLRYAPLWQDYEAGNDQANIRAFGALEDIVRVPLGNIDVTNPVNTGITIDKDETFFGGKFTLSQAANDVEMEIVDSKGHLVWRDKLGDLGAGEHQVTFDTPFDVKQGYRYNISLTSPSGDVVAKSNGSSGFSWTVQRATWTDKELALVEDLADFINQVTLVDGDKLEFTHQDGAKHQILLPSGGGTGGNPNPKAIISVAKSSGNFVFNHVDGTTTTLADNTGATVSRVDGLESEINVNKQSISNIDGKLDTNIKELASQKQTMATLQGSVTTLQGEDAKLGNRITVLEGHHSGNTPQPPSKTTPTFYGVFSNNIPTTLKGASQSSGKRVIITRSQAGSMRAMILIPTAHGSAVTGIKQDGGIASLWPSRDTTIDGKGYKVFYSPRGFSELTSTFIVDFAQGAFYV